MKPLQALVGGLLVLCCLSLALPGSADETYWEYTFRPGDTLWDIAREHTRDVNNWSAIQRINGIDQDRQVKPGTRIKIPVSMLKRPPKPVVVLVARGSPILVRANGEELEISTGSKIFSGDSIITGPAQSLQLRMADGSMLEILENSEIHFDKLSYHEETGMVDTRMRLPRGRVNSRVEKLRANSRYQIQTPAAITAVRGTAYRIASDPGGISRTEVTEGAVVVSAGDITRAVEEGFGLVAERGKPLPEPTRLLAPPPLSDNLASAGAGLELTWQADPGAVSYRYRVATDATFGAIVERRATEKPRLQLAVLEPGRYFVGIRAIDRNRLEGMESVKSFTIVAPQPQPQPQPRPDTSLEEIVIPSGILLLGQ
jgi:hypothetical protein